MAQLPGVLLIAASGLLAFSLGRRLFGPIAGLLACAVTLSIPPLHVGTNRKRRRGFAFFFLLTLSQLEGGLPNAATALSPGGLGAGFALLEKPSGLFLFALSLAPLLLAHQESRNEPCTGQLLRRFLS